MKMETTIMGYTGLIRVILGLTWGNGKYGKYYNGLYLGCLGVLSFGCCEVENVRFSTSSCGFPISH